MRKMYTAIILFAVILSVAFAEYKTATSTADRILEIVEEADVQAQSESGKTTALCESVRKTWENNRNSLMLFLPHNDIDQTDINTGQLVLFAQKGEYDSVRQKLAELKYRMDALKGNEEVNIVNLL